MRKVALFISVALVAYATLLAYIDAYEKTGDQLIEKLVPNIEKAQLAKGVYPTKIELDTPKVWKIFPGPEIIYRVDGAECRIYYYQWPLGPHHGYRFTTKKWYFEE